MKNYVRAGDRIPLIAPAGGVVSGGGYLIGDLFVIAAANAAAGETFTALLTDCSTLPKANGTIAQGVAVYWDNAAKNVTTTVGSNKKIGHAVTAQLAGDATVLVRLQQS